MAEFRWRPTPAAGNARRFDDVFFIDPQTGWSVNSNGFIAKTSNGGASWTIQHRAGAWMRCIGFADANHGWAGCTTATQRMFSTQNGENWAPVTNLPAQAPVKICGLSVVDRMTVYASGTNEPTDEPRMMKTTNGGETWTKLSDGLPTSGDVGRIGLGIYPVSYTHLTLPTIYSV